MNFISSDPDHIEVLESKTASNSTTEVYAFEGKDKQKNLIIILCSGICVKHYRSRYLHSIKYCVTFFLSLCALTCLYMEL